MYYIRGERNWRYVSPSPGLRIHAYRKYMQTYADTRVRDSGNVRTRSLNLTCQWLTQIPTPDTLCIPDFTPDNALVTYAYNQKHGLRSRESKQQPSDNQRFQQRFARLFPSPGVIASFNLVVRSTTYRSTMYRQFGIGFEQRKLIQLAGDRKLPKDSVGRI